MSYNLPLALIQLRQGIGRLIRSETDEGVIIFLNPKAHAGYRRQVEAAFPVKLVTELRWSGTFDLIKAQFPQKEISLCR